VKLRPEALDIDDWPSQPYLAEFSPPSSRPEWLRALLGRGRRFSP
jgi:hypothetical protein